MLRWPALAAVACLVAPSALLAPPRAAAQAFAYERVVAGLPPAADFAFAPDGRIFVAELGGAVRIVEDGALRPAAFARMPVNAVGERGLLGLALDPAFASNGHVYLYHSVETDPGDPEGPKSGRLTRVTAQGDVAAPGSQTVLLGATIGAPSCNDVPADSDCIPIDSVSHMGGALRFGPDGMLYVGVGDGIFSNVDAVRSLRAQDLDVLSGKVLRVDPADGAGLADNPYFDGDPHANRSKVWAYGVRQPFRMGFHPALGLPLVGDVGDLSFEELSFASRGANLGWPCFEGTARSTRVPNEPVCQALFAAPPVHLRFPAHAYPHVGSSSVTAGVFAPSSYPASIEGRFVFGDYAKGEVRLLHFAGGGAPTVSAGAAVPGPVDFEIGPDGRIYVLSLSDGAIYRLVDRAVNVAPFAVASADPTAGPTPLEVSFSGAGSFDSNGDAIAYEWEFGDGATSSEASPTHVYQQAGAYVAALTVRDPAGASDRAEVTVLAGREPPVVTIAQPANGATYAAGEALAFRASASDADDGALPPASLLWVARVVHCTNVGGVFDCHAHPLAASAGPALDLAAPDHGTPDPNEFYFVEARASAVDSDGLRGEARVRVGPDTDGDRCMDLFEPFALAAAPFAGASDELESALPASLAVAEHAWAPTGALTATAIAASPPNGSATSVATARLLGPLAVAEAGTYAIDFDAFVGGIAGIQPGPSGVSARLVGEARLLDAASRATLAGRTLFSQALAGSRAGAIERAPIGIPNARLPFVVALEPGDYEWHLVATATGSAVSDASHTSFGVAAGAVTLREARICRQRVAESEIP